jgi:serine/threonine protein kinase
MTRTHTRALVAVAGDQIRRTLSEVSDIGVRETLAAAARPNGAQEASAVDYRPKGRDRYTLTRLHARGGIGQVWVARDQDLGREVALKELLPGWADHEAFKGRFLEEAKITGQLEHPGVVPVYELSKLEANGAPFYTMRFIKGHTLADAIRVYQANRKSGKAGRLELRELLNNFVAVCNAVAYAHSRGVLHRDLKPQNVVLGDYAETVVLDWGLAKLTTAVEAQGSLLPVSIPGGPSAGKPSRVRPSARHLTCRPNRRKAGPSQLTNAATCTGWEPSSTKS